MTKPDSTDAGGVTHEEALGVVRAIRAGDTLWRERVQLLWRYVRQQEQQEAALATLTSKLGAYRSLAKAADAMRPSMELLDTRAYQHAIAYDTARATVANLDRCTQATTEQKAAAGDQ